MQEGTDSGGGEWTFPEDVRWKRVRAMLEKEASLEKEAFHMARGGEGFGLVKDEGFLQRVRAAIVEELNLGEGALEKAEGQPFLLKLLAGVLREAGDPDYQFLEEAEVGLPVGVIHPLPRTPAVFERQTKWSLEGEDWED